MFKFFPLPDAAIILQVKFLGLSSPGDFGRFGLAGLLFGWDRAFRAPLPAVSPSDPSESQVLVKTAAVAARSPAPRDAGGDTGAAERAVSMICRTQAVRILGAEGRAE